MKKQPITILLMITMIFAAFTAGFFIGRNRCDDSVQVSVINSQPRYAGYETTEPPEVESTVSETISFPININTADQEEFIALPGIGETLAGRIMDYREQHGSFASVEELLNVDGIGAGRLEAIMDLVITGG